MENPRPYDVMMIFTVRSGCDGCDAVFSEFTGVSYSYQKAKDKLSTPAFFGVLYYTSDPKVREIFTLHNFKTVPYLATTKMVQKREDVEFYKSEDIWLVRANEAAETQQILDFANKSFNNDVPIQTPLHVVMLKNLVLFVVLGGLIVLVVKIRVYLIDQYLWLIIAWVSYVICTSGVVYTILNTVPVFRFD